MATDERRRQTIVEQDRGEPIRFLLDVNRHFTDKVKPGDKRFYKLNTTFATVELTVSDLASSIQAGYAWTNPHAKIRHKKPDGRLTTYRVKKNYSWITAVALDSDTEDERSTLDAWRDYPMSSYAALRHTTASHTDDAPRSREVYILEKPLPREDAERLIAALHKLYPHVDTSAKDASRIFYGAKGCQVVILGNVLPDDVAQALIAEVRHEEEEKQREVEARRAAFASSRTNRKANAGAVAAYVASAKDRRLAHVAAAVEGTGERHQRLIEAAFRLGSIRGARWLTDSARRVMSSLEDELLDATYANGYATKYGADEARRVIRDSVALGEAQPAIEPDWRAASSFFSVGDAVIVVHDKQVMARGCVAELRKSPGDSDYLFRLDGAGVWYPRAWLRPDNGELDDEPDEAAEDFFSQAAPALDGRGRDIYAGLVGEPALVVDLPPGAYLSDVLDVEDLPRLTQLNANTGTGKTTFAEDLPGQVVLVTSSTVALEQIVERRRAAGAPVDAYYQNEKSATGDSQLIVTTYESFRRVLNLIDASRFSLVVDEVHNVAASSSRAFRGRSLEAVVDTLDGAWRRVIVMSGTPMPSSHPALRKFSQVNVISQIRGQLAQRIIYKVEDENGREVGSKLEAVLAQCDTSRSHLVFLNDKRSKLDKLYAGLISKGFEPEQIAIVNSDTKHSDAGQQIIRHESIPDGVRVVIATSVLVEAANLLDKLDAIHLYSNLHPYHAQQLVNRLRTSAAGIVYFYNASDGKATSASVASHHAHYLRDARSQVNHLNQFASDTNPNDDSDEARLRRRSLRQWAGYAGELVRVDEDELANTKWWDVSYLGVDNATFSAITDLANHNPQLYKNMLAPFGWQWLPDLEVVATRPRGAARTQRDEVATMRRDEREAAHLARVEQIQDNGEAWTVDAVRSSSTDSATLRAAGDVLRLKRTILDDVKQVTDSQHEHAWRVACELVKQAGDSRRKVNTAARRLKIQRLRGRCSFTDSFYQAFSVGERISAEEVHQRVLAIFASDKLMSYYAANRYEYHFSQQAAPRISQRRAVELVGDMFTLKRTSQRDAAGAVVHVYEVVDDEPLGEVVATLGQYIKQFSVFVATEDDAAPAFALSDSGEDEGDILDWFLATERRAAWRG